MIFLGPNSSFSETSRRIRAAASEPLRLQLKSQSPPLLKSGHALFEGIDLSILGTEHGIDQSTGASRHGAPCRSQIRTN